MIRFALANLLRSRMRTALALIGLGVAIASLVGLVSFSVGLRAQLDSTADEVGGIMVLDADNISPAFSRLDALTIEQVRAVEGVRAVSQEVFGPVLQADGAPTITQPNAFAGIPVYVGIDPVERKQLRGGGYFHQRVVQGRDISEASSNEIIIGVQVAEGFGKQVGSPFQVMGREFEVVGLYESTNPLLSRMIVMHIERARDILQLRADVCTALFVEASDPANTAGLARAIEEAVPDIDARSIEEWAEIYGELSKKVDVFLAIITSFAVIVGAIGIANTMLMSVTERTGEIGVLRATGWSRGDVLKLVIVESLTLALAGGVLGILLGYGVGRLIAMRAPIEPFVSPGLASVALALAAITGTLGGMYPAWRAARLDVVSALRYRDL